MHFAFTDDQKMLRDTVRDVLSRECPPEVVRKAWEEGTGRAASVWATLADTGLTSMTLGEGAGGMGMSEVDWVLPVEEAGYAALPDPLVETVAVGIPLLESIGTDAQKGEWLEKAASGEALIAIGFEGPRFVPHAPIADLLILERDGGLYAVPRAELEIEEEISVDRARKLASVRYSPSEAHRMNGGDEGKALALAFDRAALGSAACLLGLTRRMLDMTVDYAKDREQFGKPIGAQQAVKHRLSNALIAREFARPLVYRAAHSLSHDVPHARVHVSLAKLYASRSARFVAKQALQVHGAIGYTIEHDLHMWMKRSWALAAAHGDEGFHRDRIGAAILPEDASEDLVMGLA